MLGLIETGESGKMQTEKLSLLGMRCLRVRVAAGRGGAPTAKGLSGAAKYLKENGVFRICPEEDFECGEAFGRAGFVFADAGTYRAAVAGKALAAAGGRCAAVFAPQLTPVCEKPFLEMCAHFERVMLKLDSGGEGVCLALERLTGVSALNDPSKKMLAEADAAVFFSAPMSTVRLSKKCMAYSVRLPFPSNVKCRRIIDHAVPGIKLPGDISERYCEEKILSEALLAGTLKADELEIVSLKQLDS